MLARHRRTGNVYEIINSAGEMKHPDTGEWIVAVIYMPHGHQAQYTRVYAREFNDFHKKFEAIE